MILKVGSLSPSGDGRSHILSEEDLVESGQSKQSSQRAKLMLEKISISDEWKTERKIELRLKLIMCSILIIGLIIQTIFVNYIILKIGEGILKYDEWLIRIFIVGVFGEIVALIKIILNSLFPQTDSKDMIELISSLFSDIETNNKKE